MRYALLFLLCLLPSLAMAQDAAKPPIEVTAKQTLEWDRNKQTYTARGDAIAKQGNTEIRAQTLVAHYTDDANTLTRIHARDDVTLTSDTSRMSGQQGWYDIATGKSEMTGNNLKLTTPTDTVTARDKMTYDTTRNEMRAIGKARAVRPNEIVDADTLIARFEKDPKTGENQLYELEAIGNVTITTDTDVLQGDRAIYLAKDNIATVTGHVRITREANVITGARGEIDLNTNISRIFADPAENTRVRGVFYPE